MSEWEHGWSDSKGVCDLIDGSKPRSDICDVPRRRKIEDVFHEARSRLDPRVGDEEPKEVDL